jgi:hypothetical protein
MMLPPLIGLTGHLRSGKDTVADMFVHYAGYTKLGFADALRRAALALDPFVAMNPFHKLLRLSEVVNGPMGWTQAKEEIPEVRQLLQRLGTEVGRDILGPNVWVQAFDRERYRLSLLEGAQRFVVPDVRFRNEADYVKDTYGSVLIRVLRPGFGGDKHPSETEQDTISVDGDILNESSIGALQASVEHLVDTWGREE